jgi:outer membrane protein assembly factor BamB
MSKSAFVIIIFLVFAAAGCSGATARLYASPWPMFQKDVARTGRASAPQIEKPAILWKTFIGIQGYLNCPIIADGRVYVGSSGKVHNESDEMDGIYCLDYKTGRILWFAHTDNDSCGVAFDDGVVYATGDDGFLRALDAEDGTPIWNFKGAGQIVQKCICPHCETVIWDLRSAGPIYCQPLVIDSLVVVENAGAVIAFDKKTGRTAWETKICFSPIRGGCSSDGEKIYAAFVRGSVICLDLSGTVIWKRELTRLSYDKDSREPVEIYGAPTICDNMVLVTFSRDTYYETPAVYALDKRTGETIWTGSNGAAARDGYGNIRTSPVIWKNFAVYAEPYSNEVVAIGLKTGACEWSLKVGIPMFPHWPSGAVAGDTLYMPRHDGGLYAVDLVGKKLKWQFYLGKSDLADEKLPDGIQRGANWEEDPAVGIPVYASCAIGEDGTLILGTGEGFIYAIGNQP